MIKNNILRLFIYLNLIVLASCELEKTQFAPVEQGFATVYVMEYNNRHLDTLNIILCTDCSGDWGNGKDILLNFECEDYSTWSFHMTRLEFEGKNTIHTTLGSNRDDINLISNYQNSIWSIGGNVGTGDFGARNDYDGITGRLTRVPLTDNGNTFWVTIDFEKLKK